MTPLLPLLDFFKIGTQVPKFSGILPQNNGIHKYRVKIFDWSFHSHCMILSKVVVIVQFRCFCLIQFCIEKVFSHIAVQIHLSISTSVSKLGYFNFKEGLQSIEALIPTPHLDPKPTQFDTLV
jgi:hypothetical protein